jgi:hypothetical protein
MTSQSQTKLVTRSQVARRYACTSRTIQRWERNPPPGFPMPVAIKGRWYFDESLLDEHDRQLVQRGTKPERPGTKQNPGDAP